ncbi:MAG: stage II sporulation protein M [Oscillospiraceae bacterium]|nr:stage II sporulation protein M [Oscillospiraceae bacterium]
MKNLLRRLQTFSADNPAVLMVLMGVCFIIGAFAGGYITAHLQGESRLRLTQTFHDLYAQLQLGNMSTISPLPAIRNALLLPTIVYIFSFSLLGVAIAPFAMAVKGFALSVTVTAFVMSLGLNGLWFSIASVGIPALVTLPLFMLVCMYTFRSALRRTTAKTSTGKPSRRMAAQAILTVAGLFATTAIYEAYAVPPLLGWLASRI